MTNEIEKDFNRPNWDEYFLQICKVVSTRSVCYRSQCGSVIVKDKAIISTGYNGSPKGQRNCREIGYCYRNKHQILSGTQLEKCRAIGSHGESNAVVLAAKNHGGTDGATIYIYGNTAICAQCRAIIANAGIIRVVYRPKNTEDIIEYIPELDWNIHPLDMTDQKK